MKENDRGKTEAATERDVLDEDASGVAPPVLPQQQHTMVREHAGLLGGSVQEEGVAHGPQEDQSVYAGLGESVRYQTRTRATIVACCFIAYAVYTAAWVEVTWRTCGTVPMHGVAWTATCVLIAAVVVLANTERVIHCD